MTTVVLVAVSSMVAADASSAATAMPIHTGQLTVSPVAASGPSGKSAVVASRPDEVSAQLAARAQGSRVEIESARTETSTSWANPDGTTTMDSSAGPVRFRDPAGVWQPVDLTLQALPDGTVTPKGAPGGLRLAGARKSASGAAKSTAGTDIAVMTENAPPTVAASPTSTSASASAKVSAGGSRQIVWGVPGTVGAPTLVGDTATYANVSPGVDLVVTARRTGFEQSFVLRDRSAVDALVASAKKTGTPVGWSLPVRATGLTPRAVTAGAKAGRVVEFVDPAGAVRSRFELPVAFDAARDPYTGEPVSSSLMKLVVTPATAGKARAGRSVVSIVPDLAWLTSPTRSFPVTIDPTYASGTSYPSLDTFVQQGYTTSQSSASELKLGNNGSGQVARSYLSFSTGGLAGKVVKSATLSLYETWSWSCTPRLWEVYPSAAAPSTSTVWTNQPGGVNPRTASSMVTKGANSSCAAGWVTQDVKATFASAASSNASTASIQLRASDEADPLGWKRFASSETTNDPHISYTYNRVPNIAAYSRMTTVASYTPPGGTAGLYTPSSKPTFYAKATDADGDTVAYIVNVLNSAGTIVSSCATTFVASGTEAGCTVGTALTDNTAYTVRFATSDNMQQSGWSATTAFKTAFAAPPTPSISCPAPYTNGSWQASVPTANVTCTVTATGSGTTAPGYVLTSVDGAAETVTTITQPTSTAARTVTVTVPKAAGGHKVTARTKSPSGTYSTSTASYGFGYGPAAMDTPVSSPVTTTTDRVKISASGPKSGTTLPTATLHWRVAGSGQDEHTGWTNVTMPDGTTNLTVAANAVGGVTATYPGAGALWDLHAAITAAAAGASGMSDRVPALVEVEVAFHYAASTSYTWNQDPTTVQYVPHAFGNGFPEADAGPGKVALWTGEFATDTTDASVPGYNGSLSVARSHATYAGPATPVNAVFGPGWSANFDGPDAGAAGLSVLDSTRADGTIALVDGDGSALVFKAPAVSGKTQRTTANLTSGRYTPANEDTRLDGSTLTVTGAGAATVLTYTQDDGTITTFTPTTASTAPTASAAGLFAPATVTEPAATSTKQATTTFYKDTTGKVTNIVTAAPGVTCTVTPGSALTASTAKGCRALLVTYAGSTTATAATPGDISGQVKQVAANLWDPAASSGAGAMVTIPVATYTYDVSTRLSSVKDPRTNLATSYTYDSTNRLASLTPPGLAPFTLTYDTTTGQATSGRLLSVSRTNPTGTGTTRLAAYAYGTPLSGEAQLPTITAVASTLDQAKTPTYAAAVFGQDYQGPVPPPTSPATGSTGWKNADLQYTDALGYTIDTASFGAGDWQYTATDYDELGNTTRTLDVPGARAVLDGDAVADQAASYTLYNPDLSASTSTTTGGVTTTTTGVVTPKGTLVVDTLGPARFASVPDTSPGAAPGASTTALVRPRTHTDYDQGAPSTAGTTPAEGKTTGAGINPATGMPYRLPTTAATTAVEASVTVATLAEDPTALDTDSVTRTGYDKGTTGSADGWALGSPVTVTTDMGTGNPADNLVKTTVYDDEGAVVSTTQPSSAGAIGGAGTRTTLLYTSGPNASLPTCGDHPEWAGLTCRVSYGTPDTGQALPSTVTTYTALLQPATVAEYTGTTGTGLGTLLRTTTTHYDSANRPDQTTVTTTGAVVGSSTVSATGTVYDPATGAATATTRLDTTGGAGSTMTVTGQDTTRYDSWGRTVSYQPAGESTATTTAYDPATGRVASVTDAKGVTSYGYDQNNPDGTPYERRGLTTSLSVTTTDTSSGVPTLTGTGTYNADGDLVTETLPGGISRTATFDEVGQLASLQYTGDITPVTTATDPDTGTVTYTPGTVAHDQPWLGWTQDRDIGGSVVHEWTPVGSAFTDGPSVDASGNPVPGDTGDALGYDRRYTYDRAGRLTQVKDRTAAITGTVPDETTGAYTAACQTRTYTFDKNGNRTRATTEDAPATGTGSTDCPTGTGASASTKTWSYDSADRLTTGAGLNGAAGVGSYVYDALGRVTTVPAVDSPNGTPAGDLTLGYFDTDAVASLTQGGTVTRYTLDVAGRRTTQTTQPVAGPPTTDAVTRHYTDTEDNPTWVEHTTGTGTGTVTTSTRYAETLGGDLGLEITTGAAATPDVELPIANPHGDTVTTIAVPVTGTGATATLANATCIEAWADYDEYGNAKTPATITGSGTGTVASASGGVGYGWLGNKQRATDPTSGLILMGARLYDRITGQFTSVDPVYGGNTTNYTYPQDPVNARDLSGESTCVCDHGSGGNYVTPFAWGAFGALLLSLWHPSLPSIHWWWQNPRSSRGSSYSASRGVSAPRRVRNAPTYGVIGFTGHAAAAHGSMHILYMSRAGRGRKRKSGSSGGSEHLSGKRKSTKGKHEQGRSRKGRDAPGGEKGDRRRQW